MQQDLDRQKYQSSIGEFRNSAATWRGQIVAESAFKGMSSR